MYYIQRIHRIAWLCTVQLSVELLSELELRVLSAFSTLIKNSCGKIKYFFEDFFYLFRGEDINRVGKKVWLLEKAAINHPLAAICFIIGISPMVQKYYPIFRGSSTLIVLEHDDELKGGGGGWGRGVD